jgi:uncharacterized membrane protein YkoI
MLRSKIISAAVAVTVALGSTVVFAANGAKQDDERQEAAAVLNAKTSLAQAIAAAEQHTGGKAIDSGIENRNGKVIGYDGQGQYRAEGDCGPEHRPGAEGSGG